MTVSSQVTLNLTQRAKILQHKMEDLRRSNNNNNNNNNTRHTRTLQCTLRPALPETHLKEKRLRETHTSTRESTRLSGSRSQTDQELVILMSKGLTLQDAQSYLLKKHDLETIEQRVISSVEQHRNLSTNQVVMGSALSELKNN